MPYNCVISIFFSIIPIVPLHPPYYTIVVSIFFSVIQVSDQGSRTLYGVYRNNAKKLETTVLGHIKVFRDYIGVVSSPRYLLSGRVMAWMFLICFAARASEGHPRP